MPWWATGGQRDAFALPASRQLMMRWKVTRKGDFLSSNFYDVSVWEEIRSMVSWKTDQLVEDINKEISRDASLTEFQGKHPVPFQLRETMKQRANAWVQRLYQICCDAHKSRGKTPSVDFDRAVWFYRIQPFIMGETDSQIHNQTMGGFLNLLLCAVGSPPERRSSLTVSQKESCFDVRMKVYETWYDQLHHLPPRINEAAAVMAQANLRERRAARIAAGLPPDDPPLPPAAPDRTFRWENFDQQLITLKLASLSEQMEVAIAEDERLVQAEAAKKGNSAYFLPAFFEKQEQRTREWARKVFATYCEVWQLQGGTVTLIFAKAVFERGIEPLIVARQGSAENQVMLRATRIGSTHNPQLPAAVGQWHRQIQNLRVSLWREFEIETSERKYKLDAQQADATDALENSQNHDLPQHVSPKKTVHVTKAPPTISEVGGVGTIHGPKPTEAPLELPVDYPRTLVARTFMIVGEAVRKFPVQTQIVELCRHVICELTPHFQRALRDKVFQQDQALSTMHDLVHGLVVHNCGDGKRSEVEKEVRTSDEWLTLAKEIAREIANEAAPGAAKSGGTDTATWDAIEISFLSDERVQIRNGANSETRNYAEFGFADGRSKKANQAWETLRVLAAEGGTIRDGAKMSRTWPKVEKRMQEIRKVLRKHFGISADPIPFVEGSGYQARFKIGCGPSFDT
jgi:hypothetical protein